jgi:hypothetical protein
MLHVIYRSYGGENSKGRPDYYSKRLCLASFVRAAARIDSDLEVIYLNDGPIPEDCLELMRGTGEILARDPMGLRLSLKTALALPAERGWAPDDLVWFAEDDYLYLPEALVELKAACQAFDDAEYLGLYALIGNIEPNGEPSEDDRIPARLSQEERQVNGRRWRRALSTTSTFGARVAAIAEDRAMMAAAMACGGAFDHTTCLAYQGYRPYPLSHLISAFKSGRGGLWRRAAIAAVRAGSNLYFQIYRLRTSGAKTLFASDPALITHVQTASLAEGAQWELIARETEEWLGARAERPLTPMA